MMKYFIAKDGKPAGPFTYDELIEHGMTEKSLVWNDSLVGWTRAGKVQELAVRLNGGVEPEPEAADKGAEPLAGVAGATGESPYAPKQPAADPVSPYAPKQPEQPVADPVSPYAPKQPEQQPEQPPVFAQPQYAQPQYEQPAQPVQPPQQPHRIQYTQAIPETNKTMSIIVLVVSLLCSCNLVSAVLAVIALVKSGKVTSAMASGNVTLAEYEAKSARTLSMAALVLLIVGGILIALILAFGSDSTSPVAEL